jgi:8-oxo-dGTP pyrophosphatase MutT (NUDIX family)
MRRLRTSVFHAYARIKRPITLGVRAAVENEAGKVFMVRHTYVPGWYLPGGGVERGETAETSLARELVEEAGVALSEAPLLFGVYSNHALFRNDHVLVYRVPFGRWSAVKATSVGEIAESAWVDPSDPPEGTTPGNARRLAELYGGAALTPHW